MPFQSTKQSILSENNKTYSKYNIKHSSHYMNTDIRTICIEVMYFFHQRYFW